MFNQIICTIFMSTPMLFQALAMDSLLMSRKPKYSRRACCISWILLTGWGIVFRIVVNDYHKTQIFSPIYGIATYFIWFAIFYKDIWWRKIVIAVAIFFGTSMSEIGLIIFLPMLNGEMISQWDYTEPFMIIVQGCGMVLSIMGIGITYFICKKIMYRGTKMKNMSLFVLFALGQCLTFQTIGSMIEGGRIIYSVYVSMLLSFLCSVVLLVVILTQTEKEKVEQAYSHAYVKKDMEHIHYADIIEKRQELEKITSDNKLMLEKTEILIREDKKDEAEGEIMHFLQRLDSTREYPYCSIPIINVILAEKKKECEKNQIDLNMEILIFQELHIKQVDLCSAFSNILDNAIKANKQIVDGNEKTINLRAAVVGEYFVIKCENTYQKSNGRFAEGSGYGLKILKEIALNYRGELFTKNNDNIFGVQLNLRNS